MEEKFKEILEDHGIYGEDVTDVLYAVCDMFTYMADETRRDEPYATKSIDRFEKVAAEISMLISNL